MGASDYKLVLHIHANISLLLIMWRRWFWSHTLFLLEFKLTYSRRQSMNRWHPSIDVHVTWIKVSLIHLVNLFDPVDFIGFSSGRHHISTIIHHIPLLLNRRLNLINIWKISEGANEITRFFLIMWFLLDQGRYILVYVNRLSFFHLLCLYLQLL